MTKNKSNSRGDSFSSGFSGLSTLGDALREKNPEIMKKFDALRESESTFHRIVEVLGEQLPYAWKDINLLGEAIELIQEKDYPSAIAILEQALEYDPNAYPAHHLLGLIYGGNQDYKLAGEHLRKAIKLQSRYPQGYLDLGQVYYIQGKSKKAFECFKEVVRLVPDFVVAEYWLGFVEERLGIAFGRSGYGQGSAEMGRFNLANCCCQLGNAYIEFGHHIAARHALKKSVRLWDSFAEAYFLLGELHVKKLRNPKRAVKYLEKAEKLFVEQGDLHRAAQARQIYCPINEVQDPETAAEEWLKEGLRLQGLGHYQGALDAYKMVLHFRPNDIDAYYNTGIAYGSQQDSGILRIDKAVGAFRQVLRLKPDYIHAHIALGASFIKRGNLEDAVATLEEALEINPEEPNVLHYLGVAHRMSSRFSAAIDVLKKSVAFKPDSVQVQFYLALTLMDVEKFEEANEVFQQVVRIKPDFADGHFMLGNLYLHHLCETDKALLHLKKAEKLFLKLEDYHRAAQIRELLHESSIN
jgi:tetratricopeptide (TPR) repeat protein